VPPAALALAFVIGSTASAMTTSAWAAEAVVVASTAPGYALGQVVPDGAMVKLPDGAGALFLFATGRTVRVKGPYEGQLDKMPEAASRAAVGSLLSGDRFMQSELGATRAVGNPLERGLEQAFAVDPGTAGTVCARADAPPMLKRPRDPALSAVSLRDPARGAAATVTWTGAAGTAPWPKDLAVRDGGEVAVSGPDGRSLGTLKLRVVDAATDRGAALAVKLASAGCEKQAAALLSPLRDAMAPLDVYLSTDRGTSAAYKAGEAVRLVLQTNRDAHVYCYVRNARGQLIPIFPSTSSSSLVEGSVPLSMPGERMPMPLRASEPAGDMEVRCLAADRDLGSDLPGRNEAFQPLSEDTVARLDHRLGALRDTEIVMAQVFLRVR